MAQAPFIPTDEQRRRVAVMAAAGIIHDKIAAAIGCSDETLRKYFDTELKGGAAQILAGIAEKLLEKANEGNVAAAKAYTSIFAPKPVATEETGVKAERQAAAEKAGKGTVWEEIQKQH